jgi:hypothetical protein
VSRAFSLENFYPVEEIARCEHVEINMSITVSKRSSRKLRKTIYPRISQIDADLFMHSESVKMGSANLRIKLFRSTEDVSAEIVTEELADVS